MKITAPSADFLIKIALLAVGVGVVLYAVGKVTQAASGAVGSIGQALQTVNPANENNVLYQTANALTPGTGNTFGGWLYDITHPDPMKQPSTGGASGSW